MSEKETRLPTAEAPDTAPAVGEAAETPAAQHLLEVRHLRKYFPVEKDFFGRPVRFLRAVDDVSFTLDSGKTIGVVGESGCGKTTLGRTILQLTPTTEGEVIFNGKNLEKLSKKDMIPLRRDLQIIFQDPFSSLSPRMPVGEIIGEAVKVHHIVPDGEVKDYVLEVMRKCGLADHYYNRYPHEFSGGQRQRICIARALALKPKLVICDEPVSALDVSIQAQIINLLKDLQTETGVSYVFISHDLSVVEYISDDVLVMYLGNMMEKAPTADIFGNPMHPYTKALFSAVPIPDPKRKHEKITLQGDIPSPSNPPSGCKFHTRCAYCMEVCKTEVPAFHEAEPGHFVACHLFDDKQVKPAEKH